jgi:hypothetical protein
VIVSLARPRLFGYTFPSTPTSYSTTFANDENPLLESVNGVPAWLGGKTVGRLWNDMKSVGGGAFSDALNPAGFDDSRSTANPARFTITANQFIQGRLIVTGSAPTGSQEAELHILATTADGVASGYEFDISRDSNFVQFIRWNGDIDAFTQTGVFAASAGYTPIHNDLLRIESVVTGTSVTLTAFINTVQVLQIVDNTAGRFSSGMPGIGCLSRVDPVTNFGWGNIDFGSL